MSKEILLAFARGDEIKKSHIVVYEVELQTGEIIINSCEAYSSAFDADDIFVRICSTKEDAGESIPEEEIRSAIKEYKKRKEVLTI